MLLYSKLRNVSSEGNLYKGYQILFCVQEAANTAVYVKWKASVSTLCSLFGGRWILPLKETVKSKALIRGRAVFLEGESLKGYPL